MTHHDPGNSAMSERLRPTITIQLQKQRQLWQKPSRRGNGIQHCRRWQVDLAEIKCVSPNPRIPNPNLPNLESDTLRGAGVHLFSANQWGVLAVGFLVSFLVAWAVIAWFMHWVRRHGFVPFAIYRIVLGVGVLAWAAMA